MSSDGCTDSKVTGSVAGVQTGTEVQTGPVMMETWGQTDTGVLSTKDLLPKPWTEDDEDEKVHRCYPWPAHIRQFRFPDGTFDFAYDNAKLIKKVQNWMREEEHGNARITYLGPTMIIDEIIHEPKVRLTRDDIDAIAKVSARRTEKYRCEAYFKDQFEIWWYKNGSQFQFDRLCTAVRRFIEACGSYRKANSRFIKYKTRFIKVAIGK